MSNSSPVQFEDTEAPVGEPELAQVEQRLGLTFPASYRAHLLRSNGGRPDRPYFAVTWPAHADPGLQSLTDGSVGEFLSVADPESVVDLVEQYEGDRGYIPDGTVAIARDPGGNPILLGVAGPARGRVFYLVRHEGSPGQHGPVEAWDNVAVVAADFDEFLAALRPEDVA